MHFEFYSNKEHERPIAVVKPVTSSKMDISQLSEVGSFLIIPYRFVIVPNPPLSLLIVPYRS